MEIPEIIKKKTIKRSENKPESVEMKKNIIQRAKPLLDDNRKLTKRVMGKNWNVEEKEKILNALKKCEEETERTAESFFAAADISNGFADEYKEREVA